MNKIKVPMHEAANNFIVIHAARLSRTDLILQAVDMIVDTHEVSRRTAEIVVLQAFSEYEAGKCGAYIDGSLTTAYGLFIRDVTTGTMRVFNVNELVELARNGTIKSMPVPSRTEFLATGCMRAEPVAA
jgi:hypothetical protein